MNIHQIFPIGTVFKTNYSVLTHKLKGITENCTRPDCGEKGNIEPTKPHFHFWGNYVEYGSHSNFNGYILRGGAIVNLFRPEDKIEIIELPKGFQLNLF